MIANNKIHFYLCCVCFCATFATALNVFTNSDVISITAQRRQTLSNKYSYPELTSLSLHRRRRSLGHEPRPTTNYLNDTHLQMLVHWVGDGSDAIFALGRNRSQWRIEPNSALYISRDYGVTFQIYPARLSTGSTPIFDSFYKAPGDNDHYVFTDIENKEVCTTSDTAHTIVCHAQSFVPRFIKFHPAIYQILFSYDERNPRQQMWKSMDFGLSWTLFQENVKNFYWGASPLDTEDVVYVQRADQGSSYVLRTSVRSQGDRVLMNNVVDFEVRQEYMFATVKQNSQLKLMVSYNRGEFQEAQIPSRETALEYYIVDSSEGQVFLIVHTSTGSKLYISDTSGLRYSLSLSNVVYFNPEGANNDTWLSFRASTPFADIERVEGLRGIYIASQLTSARLDPSHQRTLITFNKGADWVPLECNSRPLHLSQLLSTYSDRSSPPIISSEGALGIVMATGTLNDTVQADDEQDVFISRDGGISWNKTLTGQYYYSFGDHGGILVAVKQNQVVTDLLFSLDEGHTWHSHNFTDLPLQVYGVLIEPGEATTVFLVFGAVPGQKHSWVVVTVDFADVFARECLDDDYKYWSPTDSPRVDCLLGRTVVYERRKEEVPCYNGREYEREIQEQNCTCGYLDFECDFGYIQSFDNNTDSFSCLPDPDETGSNQSSNIPTPCPDGTMFTRSDGYRKVPGDTCEHGDIDLFGGQEVPCPITSEEDFLMYVSGHAIHRHVLSSGRDTLFVNTETSPVAVDYDYANHCVFYSEPQRDVILKTCAGKGTIALVEETTDSVEGLAFDWFSGNLFWVDAGRKNHIEVARGDDGSHRRVLVANTSIGLDKPRAIALSPRYGLIFWTDWSETKPAIMSSLMTGQNVTALVSGTNRVGWPNGLAVDHDLRRLYWVDALLDQICYASFLGTDFTILVASGSQLVHPFAVTVFKENLYWTDWQLGAILRTNKRTGQPLEVYLQHIPQPMGIVAMHRNLQVNASMSPCSQNRGGCPSLCVEAVTAPIVLSPAQDHVCLCSDEFTLPPTRTAGGNETCHCEGGETVDPTTGYCQGGSSGCGSDQFRCADGDCIPLTWQCDRDNDCGDFSDERGCNISCLADQFTCANAHCIPATWVCDHDNDCRDGSDEPANCEYPTCADEQFTCSNGRCVPRRWVCDHDDDCHDYSDERGCNQTVTCDDDQFACAKNEPGCVALDQRCDGTYDCSDGSDEASCVDHGPVTTPVPCSYSWQFRCPSSGQCIGVSAVCDGINDCSPGAEDEQNCTSSGGTTPTPCSNRNDFNCVSGGCVSWLDVCDGVGDCSDHSDERFCGSTTSRWPTTTPRPSGCEAQQYACLSGQCILEAWVCDGENDCYNGDDEDNCNGTIRTCSSNQFQCVGMGVCLPASWVCDGDLDCLDHSDERGCDVSASTVSPTPHCHHWEFDCRDGSCVPVSQLCDGIIQCLWSGRDEALDICPNAGNLWRVSELHYQSSNASTLCVSYTGVQGLGNFTTRNYSVAIYTRLQGSESSGWTKNNAVPFDGYARLQCVAAPPGGEFQYTAVLIVDNRPGAIYTPIQNVTNAPAGSLDPARDVSAIVSSGQIVVSFTAPQAQTGITGYIVSYQRKDSPYKQSLLVPTHPQPFYTVTLPVTVRNGTYVISVTSQRGDVGGKPSAEITVDVDDGSVSAGCHITLLTELHETRAHVTWQVDGVGSVSSVTAVHRTLQSTALLFIEFTDLQSTADRESALLTGKDSMTSLTPHTRYDYVIQLRGKQGNYLECMGGETTLMTEGDAIEPPQDVSRYSDVTDINLSWTYSLNTDSKIEFTVFYSHENLDLFGAEEYSSNTSAHVQRHVSGRHDGSSFSTVLSGLEPCELYFLRIQMTSPYRGPPTPLFGEATASDNRSPPKHVTVTSQNTDVKVTDAMVTWQLPCDEETNERWRLKITEVKENNTSKPVGQPSYFKSEAGGLEFVLRGLTRGATYRVEMSADLAEPPLSKPVVFTAAPYGAPVEFKAMPATSQDGSVVALLSWKPPRDAANLTNLVYGIYHAENYINSSLIPSSFSRLGNTSSNTFLTGVLEPSMDHGFKVRLENVTGNGYPGSFSLEEIVPAIYPKTAQPPSKHSSHGNNQDGGSGGMSVGTISAITVPLVATVLVLGAILAVYVIRHRRLQSSFLSFANSHYDTRSGRTTFAADSGLGDDDEPMIRGFSDDEPLVIA